MKAVVSVPLPPTQATTLKVPKSKSTKATSSISQKALVAKIIISPTEGSVKVFVSGDGKGENKQTLRITLESLVITNQAILCLPKKVQLLKRIKTYPYCHLLKKR